MITNNRKIMRTDGGLIRTVILIIIALILLAYFGFNIRSIVDSPTFVDNWDFIKTTVANIWINYLKIPIGYMFNNIFIPYIWNPIIDNISRKAL